MSKRPRLRRLLRALAIVAGLCAVVVVVVVATGWTAFGKGATGERKARMERSKQWKDGHFNNPQSMLMDASSLTAMLDASPVSAPRAPVPVVVGGDVKTPPASGLRVTWFGHASTLIEVDGVRVLTDPAFGERASPFTWVGPQRWFPVLIPLDELGPIDAVVISHDHHDHLQHSSIELLRDRVPRFIVPLGIGAHLEYWGIDESRITELDWWEDTKLGDVVVTSTPARHASGRHLLDQGATLWSSWAFVGQQHRVFFSGDTGLLHAFKEVGEKLGPFDLTMIEVGQYHATWPDWHIGPEQAVVAHQWLKGRTFLPIHWALFELAPHGWTEPGERALAAAAARGVDVVLPKPGRSIELVGEQPTEQWWPEEPWQTAEQAPIVSTENGDPNVRMKL